MIQITLKTFHPAHGNHEIKMELAQNQTIRDLLQHMLQVYPSIASTCVNADYLYVSDEYNLIVNGKIFEVNGGYDYILQDNDMVAFFAACSDG